MRSSKGGPLQARKIAQEIGFLATLLLLLSTRSHFNPI